MSKQYDQYLTQHCENVKKGFDWICENAPDLIVGNRADLSFKISQWHDKTKYNCEEYEAYDNYFYGGNKSYAVVQDFNKAWLHHIHANPHHWQHWVLINDDPKEGIKCIDMPYNYILEMICDWWAFSWAKGNLEEIFNWYDEHKTYMKLHDRTRQTVENILDRIKERLNELEGENNNG